MRIVRGLAVLVVVLFAAASANAGGFRLPEAGAKAMSLGFAVTAQADDPSAIYFNPAGITQLEGQNAKVGVTYVKENGGEFTGETAFTRASGDLRRAETQKDLNFFIPNVFWTRKASPNLAYGVGVFAPFGLGQEYKDKNTSIFRDQITKIDLMTIVLNPTVAWKMGDVLSVGAGIDLMYGKAELAKTPFFPGVGNLYNLRLEGDGTAWGYNFGLLLKPSANFRIGANYRSPFTLKLKDGDVTISNTNPLYGLVPALGAAPANTKGTATLNLPATFALGAAYTMGRLTMEADADWTFWHSYRSLPIDIKDEENTLFDTNARKDWNDVVAFYLGAEYRVTDPLALRLGFRYDPTPVPGETMSPELPDADKLYYCAGAGYKFANWTIDLAYMYVDKQDRTVNNLDDGFSAVNSFNGTWKGDAHLVALDLGYKF